MFKRMSDLIIPIINERELSGRKIQIPEDRYKAELEQHGRHLRSSSELLCMALGGMGALGAIIGLFVHD